MAAVCFPMYRVVCLNTPGSFEPLAFKSDFQRATYEMLNRCSAGKGTVNCPTVLYSTKTLDYLALLAYIQHRVCCNNVKMAHCLSP